MLSFASEETSTGRQAPWAAPRPAGRSSEFLDLLGVAGAAGVWTQRDRGPAVTPLTLGTVSTQEVTSSLPDTSAEGGSLPLSNTETLTSFEILTGEELGPGFQL